MRLGFVVFLAAVGCGSDSGGPAATSDPGSSSGETTTVSGTSSATSGSSGTTGMGATDDGGSGSTGTTGATTPPPDRELGSIVDTGQPCPDPQSLLPGTTCQVLRVSCPDIADRDVHVRVTSPPGGGADVATIMFGTGGGGSAFWDSDDIGRALLAGLSNEGYRIVQRNWQGPAGWLEGPGGPQALACRYATLLAWVDANVHTGGPLCATGNSGGSAEISYGLTTYGIDEFADVLVPTSGPPLGRLDHTCLDDTDPTWDAECNALVDDLVTQTGVPTSCGDRRCSFTQSTKQSMDRMFEGPICSGGNEADRARLLAESVSRPDARYDYGDTKVRFLFATNDCNEPVPAGLTHATQIVSDVTVEHVVDASHSMWTDPEGTAAIGTVLRRDCI